MDDRVSWKDIISAWWAEFSEDSKLPRGREVEAFSYLVQTLVDHGYVRSEISRLQGEVFKLCYNRKIMNKGRLFYLQNYWAKAMQEVAGIKISTEIKPGSMVIDSASEAIPELSLPDEEEEEEEEGGVDKKPTKDKKKDQSSDTRYVEETESREEIKQRFNFDPESGDIFEDDDV